MISNSQFFVLGAAPVSPNNLRMYKITFSLTPIEWANQIVCTSGSCSASNSESLLSSDGSTIYSFFTFGSSSSSASYLYFCGLSVSDGSVATTRYKSSATVFGAWGSALKGDIIVKLNTANQLNSAKTLNLSNSKMNIKLLAKAENKYIGFCL